MEIKVNDLKTTEILKKTWIFRIKNTNSIEKLTLNTDFVNEEEATWLEELFTSPEVYILNGFSDANEFLLGNIKKYVQPVTITSNTYTRKTSANDKLLQYTVEVERTKQRVIQNA